MIQDSSVFAKEGDLKSSFAGAAWQPLSAYLLPEIQICWGW